MPIAYRIDYDARVVVTAGHGILTDADVFGYQREVSSRTDAVGFDELIDMTQVVEIQLPSIDRIKDLAKTAAAADRAGSKSRLAVVAPTDYAFALGRVFEAYRRLEPKSTKEVGIFRAMDEALAFLNLKGAPALPAIT